MQSTGWLKLLKRIPPHQHDNLMLLTSIGTEVSVQGILRMEDEYLVLRGRVAGTTDSGRIFFVPYEQINYLAFQKPVKEQEVCKMYGEEGPPEQNNKLQPVVEQQVGNPSDPAAADAAEPSPLPDNKPEPTPDYPAEIDKPPEPVQSDSRTNPSTRNALLERLRARRAASVDRTPQSL